MTAPRMRGGIPARQARIVTALGILVICLAYLWVAPTVPDEEMIDHHLFRLTTESMRGGEGYYASMAGAVDLIYGPERAAVTENVRGFRMPTTFYLFSLVPNDLWVWYLFVAVAGVSGIVAIFVVQRPILGLLVTTYLLTLGMFANGDVWVAQFMTTELWAVGPLIGAVALVMRQKWWPAALLALAAMLIRETAALVLIVGAILALAGRVPRKPWLTAFGLGGVAYLLHAMAALKFIDPDAGQRVLEELSSPSVILEMMGFGLPAVFIVGPILWFLAVWHTKAEHVQWMLTTAPLLLPFAGLVNDTKYWGILVVPFTMVWGIERVLGFMSNRTPQTQVRTRTNSEPKAGG